MGKNVKILSLIKAVSLLMFFITFAINYLVVSSTIFEAFIRGIFTYFMAAVVTSILLLLWRFAFPDQEWKIILESSALQFESDD